VETISLAADSLAPGLVPHEELADCALAVLGREARSVLNYGPGAGYTPLRELIGRWFGVHPSRVLLTNGWLQGFTLVVPEVARSQRVVVEYPINDRAERVLLDAGAALLGVPVDEQGLVTDDLRSVVGAQGRPALLSTIPTFHNPTGWTMTLERRKALIEEILYVGSVPADDVVLVEDESPASI
jgi:DNA-binding transcriptional MocR family regulator